MNTQEMTKVIETQVGMLEQRTSIEFVPVLANRSSSYLSYRGALAALCGALGLVLARLHYPAEWGGLWSAYRDLWIGLAGGVAVYGLASWPFLLRLIAPASLKRSAVVRAAHEAFLREEVFATEKRTGVLVYVSWLERQVFVLADKGLQAAVEETEWARLGANLARGLAQGTREEATTRTLVNALNTLADTLAAHFPPGEKNPNELTDRLRIYP
jgi:putative membrane protein